MKKHMLWLTELLIWGLLLLSVIFVGLYAYNKNIREKHTYYVFFHDVDGLIKGSPVKIQGHQVGYISNIAIVNEDVFITFIITDKELSLPDNIAATVEFTGMGGSKSLELFVPKDKSENKNYITTIEPRRINDFYIYQNQIAQNLVTMTSDFMKIFDDNVTGKVKSFIKKPEALNEINNTLDIIQKNENEILKRWRKNEKN